MSWYCPPKYEKHLENLNEEYLKLTGDLNDIEAKITLAKFLRHNVGFTFELLSGLKLAAFQEVALKAFFNRNYCLSVWARGCSKSFICAVFSILQTLFEPYTRIIIAGPTFRTARNIFTEIERIIKRPEAKLLAQAFGRDEGVHRNDLFYWDINGGTITAIPLNGEKIRGFRANVLILDEFLLLTEDMVNNVLMPFLVAPQNISERLKIRELEDELIRSGEMQESQRTSFANTAKMLALSSASFTFENLYRVYQKWLSNIYSEDQPLSSYFVSQISFEGVPPEMIEKTVIEEAESGGRNSPGFMREYGAQFTDGNQGYFSALKMNECTISDGSEPHIKLIGDPKKKYILSIDPSFSKSPGSDYFAMAIMELNDEKQQGTLVHNYAVAGGDLINHIQYFYYLVTNFNLVFIICDLADGNFIQSANESKDFRDNQIDIRFLEAWEYGRSGQEFEEMMGKVKREYNPTSRAIAIKMFFSVDWIRKANEYLQGNIDFCRIWFGSRIRPDETIFEKIVNQGVPLKYTGYDNIGDLIDTQDDLIYQVKKQCSLIEIKTTPQGIQTFDLPSHLKRERGKDRARKDNYTALLLGNWGIKTYYEIMNYTGGSVAQTFDPVFIS